jgi:CRP-like cAMP-binding protein
METKSFERRSIRANTTIFGEGQPGDNAYLIVTGKIEVRKGTLSEFPQVVATLGPGDIVGEMALFDERPRMAEAVTAEDSEVIVIAREEFTRRLQDMNPVMRRVLQIMVGRVRSMTDEFMKRKSESRT